jgi:alkanesulfonate monooxygenase SsuD/methylene tetrahydromethanopterin reductase-like flavin-dependent oxidoreductase (luciferase family)
LANIAARTTRVRLAPAVTVLPLHHPIRVAEQWATLDMLSGGRVDFACGRGYDRREYGPFKAPFEDNSAVFAEGLDVLRRLWTSEFPISHKGKYYEFEDVLITPRPVQRPIPTYVATFSKPSMELAARIGCGLVVAPFAVAMAFGGLAQTGAMFRSLAEGQGKPAGRMICSYFVHFADNATQEMEARRRQVRYFQECVVPALPGDPKTAPPTYKYFVGMVANLNSMRPEDLTENSVLLGTPEHMIATLKKAEAAGFSEVICYFNVGLKPHAQVKDEMQRFMEEVAPAFEGAHKRIGA